MAEDGKYPQTVYNYTTIIHGDQIGTKADVKAGEIGYLTASGGPIQEKGNLVRGVEKMSLSQTESDDIQRRSAVKRPTKTGADEVRVKPENRAQRMKADMLSDRARLLIGKSDYEGATSLLEDPCVLESGYFLPKLMLAECYLYLGKHLKGLKMIDEITKTIMTSSELKVDDVMEYANDFIDHSFHLRAIILLRAGKDMFKANASTPDDVVNGVSLCLNQTYLTTHSMINAGGRSLAIGVDYGIEYMKEILDDLRSVKNANPDNKALKEACSCNSIGYSFAMTEEYEKSIKFRQTGVEILDQQFGANASKYRIYGDLLNGLGDEHATLNGFSKAESYYVKAIEAIRNATDYDDESEKQCDIEESKNWLKDIRAGVANEVDTDADSASSDSN